MIPFLMTPSNLTLVFGSTTRYGKGGRLLTRLSSEFYFKLEAEPSTQTFNPRRRLEDDVVHPSFVFH